MDAKRGLFRDIHHLQRAGEKLPPGLRDGDALPGAHEHRRAELLFQLRDAVAHGGLRDAAPPRGLGKIQRLRQGDEVFQLRYVQEGSSLRVLLLPLSFFLFRKSRKRIDNKININYYLIEFIYKRGEIP